MHLLRFVAFAVSIILPLLGVTVEACCRAASPDPTFVDTTEYYLNSITPNRGTRGGGSRVTLKGGGFNVNFFTAGNYVYIGNHDYGWSQCDVIEGACTVQCGGPNTLVCDTGEWTAGSNTESSGWLDVKVMVEVFAGGGANEMYTLVLEDAYYYYSDDYFYTPKLLDVFPHSASAEEPLTIRGTQLGYWIQDYRMIYVGSGRAPQGGNINNGQSATETGATHAVCRPGELNSGKNPTEPDIALPGGADVMPEDRDPDPIKENQIVCALGDFMSGSYNVSVYMDNEKRVGSGSANTGTFLPGLAIVDADPNRYVDASLFSRDAHGVVHMVQYHPRVDSVSPAAGSVGGGTEVTIEGGGFAMNEADVEISIASRKCVVTFASIEKVVCNTTKADLSVVATKVTVNDHAVSAGEVPYSWMVPAQVAGDWSTVSSSSAHGGTYLTHTAAAAEPSSESSAWVTFVVDPLSVAASTSGVYELFLRLPATDQCLPRATNVTVVVRSGEGYSLQVVDLRPSQNINGGGGGGETDDGDPTETDDGDAGEFATGNGGGAVSLGTHVLLENATTLVTVDALGAGEGACVAVDAVLLKFVSAIANGCTDPTAENFDSEVITDDGSCLYLGGRGLATKSWSAMAGPYKLDDWYPVEEFDTWGTGEYCEVPKGSVASDLETCWHDDCFLHRQCGTGSFCCVTDSHEGCTPVVDLEGVDEEGWKLVFRHDKSVKAAWPKGLWHAANYSEPWMFSLLGELESLRRPGDGRFEFKMCWPGSGFKQCQHWIQLKNPLHNPSSTNTYATCVDCPYAPDADPNGDPEFRGLQYNGEEHLLDGDSDGGYMQLGSHSSGTGMYGPQYRNDDGNEEYPTLVELYVRPDPNGATCVSCKACYDQDGTVRMALYNSTTGGGAPYEAPACPAFCLTQEHLPEGKPPRETTLKASHQLVAATNGLEEKPCVTIISHDPTEDEDTNTTLCEGKATKSTDAVPSSPAFGRNGGVSTKAFFVAPMAATYTFNTRFDDGGELWLSPNADPRAAERLVAVDSSEGVASASTAPGAAAAASSFCADWTCAGDRCFKSFNALLTYDMAVEACSDLLGASLGAPRNPAEVSAFDSSMSAASMGSSGWIGITDRALEGHYSFESDGAYIGFAYANSKAPAWAETGLTFNSNEPNDHGNTENCLEKYKWASMNDLPCYHTMGFTCEIPSRQCSSSDTESENGPRASKAIRMQEGEVRYLEMLGYSNAGGSVSLLTLTVDPDDPLQEAFTTSESLGLSAEFFREIRTDGPALEVKVNGIASSCGPEGGACTFDYSNAHTPTVTAIEPSKSFPGVTPITITGTGFSPHGTHLNSVDFGGSPCVVSEANTTYIVCTVPLELGTAGTFVPGIKVFNKGFATGDASHTIQMTIDSIFPSSGSIYGGSTLTLTGSGFAKFGLHNRISLRLQSEGTMPEGTHDVYDDDWLWQRGHLNGTASTFSDVLCVPRTMKNRPCRYTDEDSGHVCDQWLAYALQDIRQRESAEWFDFSNPTSIECVVESLGSPLASGSVAVVNVSLVNTTVLTNTQGLEDDLLAAKLNFDCSELSHCQTKDRDGYPIGYFGESWDYSGASFQASQTFEFTSAKTPIVTHITPLRAMQGQLVNIHGSNFASAFPVTDTNWYMDEFGFYSQPVSADVTIGTYKCQLFSHTDTLIQCHAVYGDMYVPLNVELAVHGNGNAQSSAQFTFALDVLDIQPPSGSLAGGTTIVIETSMLHSEAAGLGFSELDVWFITDHTLGISQYIAKHLGLDVGLECKVKASLKTATSLSCVTGPLDDGAVFELENPFAREDEPLQSWLVAEWNRDEIYSDCSLSPTNCTFLYSGAMTPVLNLDSDASSLFLNQSEPYAASAIAITSGDVLKFERSTLGDALSGRAFDWSLITSVSDQVSVRIHNTSLPFVLTITAAVDGDTATAYHTVTLDVIVPPELTAFASKRLELLVEPFGFGILVGGAKFSLFPAISSISQEFGSSEGGLEVRIVGHSLFGGMASAVVGGRPCAITSHSLLDNGPAGQQAITCVTSAATVEGLSPQGFGPVDVAIAGIGSICLAPKRIDSERVVDIDAFDVAPLGDKFQLVTGCTWGYTSSLRQSDCFSAIWEHEVSVANNRSITKVCFSTVPDESSSRDTSDSMTLSINGVEMVTNYNDVSQSNCARIPPTTGGGNASSSNTVLVRVSSLSSNSEDTLHMKAIKVTLSATLLTERLNEASLATLDFLWSNASKYIHSGCAFDFNKSASHTPHFTAVEPSHGHWPNTVTLTGEGFAAEGNVVTFGVSSNATVVSESTNEIVVTVPKHVGGTFRVSVSVADKGLASGTKMWFVFDSGITSIDPKEGSRYGGQKVTITGFGFAPVPAEGVGSGSTAEAQYASSFAEWTNFGTANQVAPFDFDATYATFDTIVGTTHMRNARTLDGDVSDDWIPFLSVDVANEAQGYIGPNSHALLYASDNDNNIKNVFDQNPLTYYDGYGGGQNLQIFYYAKEPFVLTDYQVVWVSESSECPSRWVLYGQEAGGAGNTWEVVDTMDGPRTEPADFKYINRTVDNPGYYLNYRWIFREWAPRYGTSEHTSDGHRLRDIVMNPNGFAMHYGVGLAKEEAADYKVGLGFTNVAFGKPVFLSSEFGSSDYPGSYATDGSLAGLQYLQSGVAISGTASGSASGDHVYLVVDLEKFTQVNRVMLFLPKDNAVYREASVANDGLLVGVSDGWDVPFGHSPDGLFDSKRGKYEWGDIGSVDCWARQDCETSPNVTRCGTLKEADKLSGQHYLDCPPGTVARYLFLFHKSEASNDFLAIAEIVAMGYTLGNTTNNSFAVPTAVPSLPPTFSPTGIAPTLQPTPAPVLPPTPIPTTFPSLMPTPAPSLLPPTPSPSWSPSLSPTPAPSSQPTLAPTEAATLPASGSPTSLPSSSPSFLPSPLPSAHPSMLPSAVPTAPVIWPPTPLPSSSPSFLPSPVPSAHPSPLPSAAPSQLPSPAPTIEATLSPKPSWAPSPVPSAAPTTLPSQVPTPAPSIQPASVPTPQPTLLPTNSLRPTFAPSTTQAPFSQPTMAPTNATCNKRWCPQPILRSVETQTLKVSYSVFGSKGRSRNYKSTITNGIQANGISWDDAVEQCQRRGLALATVKTEAEQAAVAEAVADKMAYLMDFGEETGVEFDSVWLGAQRETARPYWHWMDGSKVWEANYTNWVEGFKYSNFNCQFYIDRYDDLALAFGSNCATGSTYSSALNHWETHGIGEGRISHSEDDFVWRGNNKIAYLCMNSITFVWETCAELTRSVYAYACEDRTNQPASDSYQRLFESPTIASVSPNTGLPGTTLTIVGQHFLGGRSKDSEDNSVEVSIGTGVCPITFANDSVVVCTLPSLESGVLPVRLRNSLGQAGPATLPLFAVEHRVASISPSSGSLGGGQLVTITGQNFPLDVTKIAVTFRTNASKADGNSSNALQTAFTDCKVTASDHTSVVCRTGAAQGVTQLSRYLTGNGRLDSMTAGLQFPAKTSVGTSLHGDGDSLRLVSQYEYTNFGDNQRPGIYVVNKDTGVEALPLANNWLALDFNIRFMAMFYDPITREVVSYCGTYGVWGDRRCLVSKTAPGEAKPKWLHRFIQEGSPDHLFVVQTHHWYYHEYTAASAEIFTAIEACGGSSRVLGQNPPASYYGRTPRDYRQYLLVGRCNAGLKRGHSAGVGLEYKHATQRMSLELQLDPFEHFTFEHKASTAEEGSGGGIAFLDYTYDEDLTPYVEWISRKNGTTAGGTTVQIVGSGFNQHTTTVQLAGVVCALNYSEIGDYRGKHLCEWEGVNCEGLGVSDDGTKLTCLTNEWDYSGDSMHREVVVNVGGHGHALTADNVLWSYANLWSSKTTWGGNDPPVEGDSVVVTYGEFILLDVSPPELFLLTIQGNFQFADNVGDLALNCSYIVLHYGRLFVGTHDAPFLPQATITLVGDRNSYELPVYGAKTLAVRTAELFMHGRPRMTPWTKLAATAGVGNTTLVLRDDTDFEPGDQIFVTSTEYQMLQAEECTVQSVSADGRVIEIEKPLLYEHWGAGWYSEDGLSSLEHYRADVGLLTRNIVVQGDHKYTKKEQFGAQIVMSTETNSDDNPLVAQFSNVEVRNAGQGLKLGKYPIHFHMVGNVSKSYVKNCSVHHSFNRGITIHGVDHLLVEHNVVFDTRGHTIFTEDGTERFNTIRYNLVAVVRPIWSLLMVDQSPACFWIVNPTNDVYGNVAGGSSHYGFWFRALPAPDGISGQATLDAGLARCPSWAELGDVRDNVAHSTGRHGMKVSNFFPTKGGYFCPTEAVSEPATFHNFTSFKNRHFGIWGEFLVDVSFNGMQFADQVKGGIEFKYMNGRSAKFATTLISNSVFVGFTSGEVETSETEKCKVLGNCQGPSPTGDAETGLFYPSIGDHGNGWTTAINLPGIGSEVEVHNTSFHNYEKAIYGCAWCVAHRGGYEMEFFNVSLNNVEHIAHFKHTVGGIILDRDGTLTGIPGATVVPPTGQWRTNPHCTMSPGGHYTVCDNTVRRVNVGITQWRSPWWDTNIKKHYPLLIATDITDEALDEKWDKWNRYPYETRVSCMTDKCGADHVATPRGANACFEQAPKGKYSFLAQVGRRYLVTWVDQNFIRTTADVEISVTKMQVHETMVLQFSHRPPLYPRLPLRASVAQGSVELWAELEPRMGAWSPPPKIPIYSAALQDHSGDYKLDPCAAGVYVTRSSPSTCFKPTEGDGFEAPQLTVDPSIYDLVNDPSLKIKAVAQGRNDNGGMLHPFIGDLKWGRSSVAESKATPEQYRSYCVQLESEPVRGGNVKLALGECRTMEGALSANKGVNLQKFKFGYDLSADWESEESLGQFLLWRQALNASSDTPIWRQPLTIVLSDNPLYCLDSCDAETVTEKCDKDHDAGNPVYLNPCEKERDTQQWYFNDETKEIVNFGAEQAGEGFCMGWGSNLVRADLEIGLQHCDGSYVWDEAFYKPTEVAARAHGAFFFDPYRNAMTRGLVQPRNLHQENLTALQQEFLSISTVPGGRSYMDYTIWNTSVLSVVVAGNTTLTIDTQSCPPEGCDVKLPEDNSEATFMWSDNATWAALNYSLPCRHEPMKAHINRLCSHVHPCGCGDVTIWEGWTVTLDVPTPFLNTLTIRGTLIVPPDSPIALAIHANLIEIMGGRLIIGNATHPFKGPMFQLVLHGDMYFHGKECTAPLDSYVSRFGCWKQIVVNGELSVHGKHVPVVTRTLAADAEKGSFVLRLDGDAVGWKPGDDLIISSSDAGGVPEYHTVSAVVNGSVVYLEAALKHSKIGTLVTISDPANGLPDTTLDGRTTVSLLTRNIEIRGGYDHDYDFISGVGPDLTDYGVTIREYGAYEQVKEGWDETMTGFDLFGKFYFPDGHITNMNFVRFRGAGKQWDLEPPFREPPFVLLPSQTELTLKGIVVTEPLTGNFFECTKVEAAWGAPNRCQASSTSLTVADSVFVGTTVDFTPSAGRHHVVRNNLFFGGEECRTDCPTHKMVSFSGSGQLSVVNNKAYGGFGGFTLRAPCSAYKEWSHNVAMGNSIGFDVEAGCTNLRLEGYRNSAGITAATPAISNFLMVENGVGVTSGLWKTWPTEKFNLPGDILDGGPPVETISNGVIVGRAPEVAGSVRSANCEQWATNNAHPWSKGYKLGGTMTGFKWFAEYGYSGFAAQGTYVATEGTGYNDLKVRALPSTEFSRLATYGVGGTDTATFHHHLDNIKFFGFSGKDSCGRRNVAISNEMAGEGEGTRRAMGAHFGKAMCYPIEVTNSQFFDTPEYARIRFSTGATTPEVQYGLCTLQDTDGSVLGGSTALDAGIGHYFLKPARKHEWPPEVLRDCTAWAKLGHPDFYEGKGTCLWWLRKYENVWPTILDPSKRGLLEKGARGTQYEKAFCETLFSDSNDVIDNNVQLCSGMEYVVLKSFIPVKKVSGSEVLYGPVGYINQKDAFFGSSTFAHEDTFVDIYRDYTDPRGDQMPPQTGTETEKFNPIDPRYTQPYLATLVNHGYYRIEYTGDITLYDKDFIEYQLVGLTDAPRMQESFALVVDIKFLKPVNLAFYYDGRQVRMSPRRKLIGLDSPAGTNYHDPVSKVLSFVLKGTMLPVRIRQLDVVSVAFGIVATFEDFFQDNFLDPNAIDAAYKDKVPPNYDDTYDPEGGNIVKTNTFVRNLASVLNINPARLRVVNIVPGNRRRLKELAEKEPHKWKHLYQRKLEEGDDEGLGVEFEIASVDPCEGVECQNGGLCNVAGTCDCTAAFEGPACNTTVVAPVNCSKASSNCPAPSQAPSGLPTILPSPHPTAAPSHAPSLHPSPLPTSAPSSTRKPSSSTDHPTRSPVLPPVPHPTRSPTHLPSREPTPYPTKEPSSPHPTPLPTTQPTASRTPEITFAELISVATDLATAAVNGTLDTGYEITEIAIAVPSDECGVPGGDSTTCFDSCGVVAGDNSTCSDVCGIPNGDGLSCLVADGVFFNCTHADSSTGVMSERQSIVLRGVSLLGTWRLAFNGAVTSGLSIYSDAETLSAAINALDTIGTATVESTTTAMPSGGGLGAVDVNIEFSRITGTYPNHLGSLPLFEVVTDSLLGTITTSEVSYTCAGTGRTGFTYEEQTLTTAAVGSGVDLGNETFVLSLNATGEENGAIGVTAPLSGLASAHDVSEALAGMEWSGLTEGSPFEGLGRANFEVFEGSSQGKWRVRFYFSPGDEALRITEFGNVPELQLFVNGNSSSSSSPAAVSLTVVETVAGVAPSSAMPFSVDLGTGESEAPETGEATTVAPVVHLCGDGKRTSAEGCDDGGLAAGDGCSVNCTVEAGFVCSTQIGVASNCFVPVTPTLSFEAASYGPFDEGTEGKATIRRIGYNGSSVSVRYTAYGSTALQGQASNGVCSTAGDFQNTSAVVLFAEGETTKEVGVALNSDGIWEQAVTLHERLVLQLSEPVGCDIDDAHKSTYVTINDVTHANFTLDYCLTDAPSTSPTTSPTRLPTSWPTHAPTDKPSSYPTPLPSVSMEPTSAPTLLPSVTPVPTPGTIEPTPLPILKPTPLPTTAPTHLPTPSPTSKPSTEPSPPPTLAPSPSPTAAPTLLPSVSKAPSPVPTPFWVGVVVDASTSATLSGYANLAAWDSDQEKLFKLALVDSVALLTETSQVTVTAVAQVARRRLSARSLLAVSLRVDYSLSNVRVGGTSTTSAAQSSLSSQLTTSFDDNSGAATSPFTSSATTLAGDSAQFPGLTPPTVPGVDVATTLAAVDSMTVAFVSVSSPPPTAQPVAPAGAGQAVVPAAAAKKKGDDDDDVTAASLATTLNILLLVVLVCLLFGVCFLSLFYRKQKREAAKRAEAEAKAAEAAAAAVAAAAKKKMSKNKNIYMGLEEGKGDEARWPPPRFGSSSGFSRAQGRGDFSSFRSGPGAGGSFKARQRSLSDDSTLDAGESRDRDASRATRGSVESLDEKIEAFYGSRGIRMRSRSGEGGTRFMQRLSSSSTRLNGKRLEGFLCEAGQHPVRQFKTAWDGFACSHCGDTFKHTTEMWGCRECDWDLCQVCAEPFFSAQAEARGLGPFEIEALGSNHHQRDTLTPGQMALARTVEARKRGEGPIGTRLGGGEGGDRASRNSANDFSTADLVNEQNAPLTTAQLAQEQKLEDLARYKRTSEIRAFDKTFEDKHGRKPTQTERFAESDRLDAIQALEAGLSLNARKSLDATRWAEKRGRKVTPPSRPPGSPSGGRLNRESWAGDYGSGAQGVFGRSGSMSAHELLDHDVDRALAAEGAEMKRQEAAENYAQVYEARLAAREKERRGRYESAMATKEEEKQAQQQRGHHRSPARSKSRGRKAAHGSSSLDGVSDDDVKAFQLRKAAEKAEKEATREAMRQKLRDEVAAQNAAEAEANQQFASDLQQAHENARHAKAQAAEDEARQQEQALSKQRFHEIEKQAEKEQRRELSKQRKEQRAAARRAKESGAEAAEKEDSATDLDGDVEL